MTADRFGEAIIQFTVVYEAGQVTEVSTNNALINHFLSLLKLSRSYHTWVNYAHDLKIFFGTIDKEPQEITRGDCVTFLGSQAEAGYADTTINRRLAAVSSMFNELQMVDPDQFQGNPVHPRRQWQPSRRSRESLYRRQPQRIPDVIAEQDLQTFFQILPSWRDRTLVLLMWLSCLRISEAVGIRFQDVECSRRSIKIRQAKGGQSRLVYMDDLTFAALNRYLDEERGGLYPDEGHLFVSFKGKTRGQPLKVNAVQKMIKYYGQQCALPEIHAHLFRHTGITQLVEQGMPEPAIRRLVGHRRAESLLPYLHLSDQFVETAFEQAQAGLGLLAGLSVVDEGGAS